MPKARISFILRNELKEILSANGIKPFKYGLGQIFIVKNGKLIQTFNYRVLKLSNYSVRWPVTYDWLIDWIWFYDVSEIFQSNRVGVCFIIIYSNKKRKTYIFIQSKYNVSASLLLCFAFILSYATCTVAELQTWNMKQNLYASWCKITQLYF